jgi:hypothetical protein
MMAVFEAKISSADAVTATRTSSARPPNAPANSEMNWFGSAYPEPDMKEHLAGDA